MQQTQRFKVYDNILDLNNDISNNNYRSYNKLDNNFLNNNLDQYINELNIKNNSFSNNDNDNLNNEFINQSFRSKIIPFQMKPFQTFDHKKLDINYNMSINNDIKNENIFDNNNFINKTKDNSYYITNKIDDNISVKEDFHLTNKICDDSYFISYNKKKAGIKLHSSMFFKNCKKVMSKNEYRKLLEIVKLSNLKKISKEDTYLSITSLLEEKYPELSNEFKLLFV